MDSVKNDEQSAPPILLRPNDLQYDFQHQQQHQEQSQQLRESPQFQNQDQMDDNFENGYPMFENNFGPRNMNDSVRKIKYKFKNFYNSIYFY